MKGLLLVAALLGGGIKVPAESPPHVPIVASVEADIPIGAEQRIQWAADAPVRLIDVDGKAWIWAPPGEHRIRCSVVWMLFEEVEVQAADGPRKIRTLKAWDTVSSEATFAVVGGFPDPTPGPQPDPGPQPAPGPDPSPAPTPTPVSGKVWVVVLEEATERTPDVAAISNDGTWRDGLTSKQVGIRIMDDDQPEAESFVPHAGTGRPVAMILDSGGRLLATCAATKAAIDEQLKRFGR